MRSMTNKEHIAVEHLRGGEHVVGFGEVAYIIEESDGVDVVFTNNDCSHWNYGERLEVTSC